MANSTTSRWQCEYTKALRALAQKGVPRGRTDEALLDIARLALRIAGEAFKRLDTRRGDSSR